MKEILYISVWAIIITGLTMHQNIKAPCEEKAYHNIVSLERGSKISGGGNFVLGFGSVSMSSNIVYYAYQEVSNGRFRLATIPKVDLIETDDFSPSYIKHQDTSIFAGCIVTDEYIYVPKGTVVKKFTP